VNVVRLLTCSQAEGNSRLGAASMVYLYGGYREAVRHDPHLVIFSDTLWALLQLAAGFL
jgi:hypothetical protein